MRKIKFLLTFVLVVFIPSLLHAQAPPADDRLRARANELAHRFIIVDTHVDVPYRLGAKWEDISQRSRVESSTMFTSEWFAAKEKTLTLKAAFRTVSTIKGALLLS